ncbi:MAG: sigma-70 family RNA polymerase sigma factor [Solirubrobacterales bacterium]
MADTPTAAVADPRQLEAAQTGDEGAFTRLIAPHRGELHAHCYRMLGSVQDAEDALQEATLRAWRALERFEGRSSLRSWLYRIATNTCLDAIAKRPKRVLPIDYAPASDPHGGPGEPVIESVWVEPYPDETLAVEDGLAGPEARYEQREAIELAFIAALQHLPANQRAVLILREVLGFSAKEVADALDTTVASVNSALQRARKAVEERTPEQSQQETLRAIGDERLRELVEEYVAAWERNDVETVVGMLASDAAFTMPPLASWFKGAEEIGVFLAGSPLSGTWRWRAVPTRANGQPALGFYTWDEDEGAYTRFALNVLRFDGEKIGEVDAFIARAGADIPEDDVLNTPKYEADARLLEIYFERFGLPERLA